MVINDNMHVLMCIYNVASGALIQLCSWINIYNLAVAATLEKEAGLVVCHQLEVFADL